MRSTSSVTICRFLVESRGIRIESRSSMVATISSNNTTKTLLGKQFPVHLQCFSFHQHNHFLLITFKNYSRLKTQSKSRTELQVYILSSMFFYKECFKRLITKVISELMWIYLLSTKAKCMDLPIFVLATIHDAKYNSLLVIIPSWQTICSRIFEKHPGGFV